MPKCHSGFPCWVQEPWCSDHPPLPPSELGGKCSSWNSNRCPYGCWRLRQQFTQLHLNSHELQFLNISFKVTLLAILSRNSRKPIPVCLEQATESHGSLVTGERAACWHSGFKVCLIGLVWHSGLYHRLARPHPIAEHQFDSSVFCLEPASN